MEGSQKFQDALKARLDLLKPSQADIENCLKELPLKLTPGVDQLIEALTARGVHVYLVSGGFRIMIEPIAKEVCVARDRIYANTIFFDGNGKYAGFDANEPTSADKGKPKALEMIKLANNYETMVMVGDGATDAQARPPATAFIGFGGVIVRPAVQAKADWFVTDFQDMISIVKKFGKAK
jgi:phosphoserine phosphatase